MNLLGVAAVGGGAAVGAWLRWWLGLRFNPIFPTVPLGTVAANLAGGFLVGLAVGYFHRHPNLAPEWRLFAVTGFLGGLTTFSTFSAEVVTLIDRGEFAWAVGEIGVHLGGSLLLTGAGFVIVAAAAKIAT